MNSKSQFFRIVLAAVVCCFLPAACSSGAEGGAQQSSAPAASESQTVPDGTRTASETAQTGEEPSSAETAAPGQTETAPPADPAGDRQAWREQYENLPQDLQNALRPTKVSSEDDFLSMQCTTLDGGEWAGSVISEYDMTVIDCWMTWCGPCREEMPTLQKVSGELPDNIQMMSVCFDGQAEKETCRSIVTSCGVTYPVLLGDDVNGVPFGLGSYTSGIPTLLFVDSEGTCFARFVGRPLTPEIEERDALNIIINLALEMTKGE